METVHRVVPYKQVSASRLLLLVIVVLSTILTACAGGSETTAPATDEGGSNEDPSEDSDTSEDPSPSEELTFGFVLPDLSNPFIAGLRDGAQAAADEAGVDLLVTGSDNPAEQVDASLNYISASVDVLGINAIDASAISAAVEEANAKGIPVIMVQASTERGDIETFIAADNVQGGVLIGESAVEYCAALGASPCKVGIIEGNLADQSGIDEDTGFRSVVEPNPDIEIVGNAPTNYDPAEALNVATNLLTANPDIDFLYSWWGAGALSAIEAVRAADRTDEVGIGGFGGVCEVNAQVIEGSIYHNTMFFPEAMGDEFVRSGVKVLQGETLPEQTDAPIYGLTSPGAAGLLSGEMDPPAEIAGLLIDALEKAESGEC